jgi:outer membrane protein OmpA-like peptidoglycan-associated protein
LIKAQAALKANSPAEAISSAGMAASKANEAHAAARGPYTQAQANANKQARNQALQRDAAAIAGITVKLKTVGQTQQVVLPVLDLFKRRKTTPRSEKLSVLNAVGELLKKYPSYPVIINGYTSSRVRRSQRYAVSQGRAQQVANHFVSMGQPLKRFAVAGRGAENPVARRWSSANDRVEIILLFQ